MMNYGQYLLLELEKQKVFTMTTKFVQVCWQMNNLYVCVRTETEEIGDDDDLSDQVTGYVSINMKKWMDNCQFLLSPML
jgi:hypothetical protein